MSAVLRRGSVVPAAGGHGLALIGAGQYRAADQPRQLGARLQHRSQFTQIPSHSVELMAFVRERLDAYKAPREVTFVDALPRTHLAKVDRGRLRREASPQP